MAPPVGYIAYIDEAGDHGLKQIRAADSRGASEWFVLAAVVIRSELESKVNGWVQNIINSLDQHQLQHLHFRNLQDRKKSSVCAQVGTLDAKLFVFMSNKKNMQNYRNDRAAAAKVNRTAWFYVWCSRVLMESVSDYCGRDSRNRFGQPRVVRLEFAESGGVKLDDLREYYKYIKQQAKLGISHNKDFPLDWDVIDHDQIDIFKSEVRPGLQLADVVASAFFAGVERKNGVTEPNYAKCFVGKIAGNWRGKKFMYGVKVMPRWIVSKLPDDQSNLLRFYQYK